MFSMPLQLIIFILFLLLILFITKYLNKIRLKQLNPNKILKINSAINLSSAIRLIVLDYNDERFLLGVSNNEIKILDHKEVI